MTTQTRPKRKATSPQAKVPARRRFTVDEYERMIEADIIHDGERVELLDGEIVCMAAMDRRHSSRTIYLTSVLSISLAGRALVSPQTPVRLPPASELEPDVMVL